MANSVFLVFLACVSYVAGQANTDGFTRPCDLDDLGCISNYLASSNLCTPVTHNDGETVHRDLQVSYMSSFNVSIVSINDFITFYGSRVERFEINPDSNNLILTVNFDGININSNEANFVFSLRGRENLVVVTSVNVTYSAAITGVVSDAGRGMEDASVSAFSTNAFPPFTIGPEITQSTDPVVSNFFQALISDIPTAVQELMLTKAPYFWYIYVQEYLCNYGIVVTGQTIN